MIHLCLQRVKREYYDNEGMFRTLIISDAGWARPYCKRAECADRLESKDQILWELMLDPNCIMDNYRNVNRCYNCYFWVLLFESGLSL